MNTPAIPDEFPLQAQQLSRAGIVLSRQRLWIAAVLFEHGDHVTASELHRRVNRRYGPVCRATVYNTLYLFVAKGLVRAVALDAEVTYYDPNTSPHHHVYNPDTGELWDVPLEQVSIEGLPPLPEGSRVEELSLVVRVRSTTGGQA